MPNKVQRPLEGVLFRHMPVLVELRSALPPLQQYNHLTPLGESNLVPILRLGIGPLTMQ